MTQTQILMSTSSLLDKLSDSQWVAIDCRADLRDHDAGRQAYEQGHLPGAVFLDLETDLAGPISADTGRHPLPDIERLTTTLGKLGIDSDSKLVVYDGHTGAFAARAWWVLRWLGHDTVYLLDGGIGHWEAEGLPIEAGTVGRTPAHYSGSPDSSKVISTSELASDIAGIPDRKLLDARDAERYRGMQEPIDSVAGHIPGVVNAPFSQFVNDNGTWRPRAERAALMEALLGSQRETAWGVMCGSGVTACHLAISGLEAGYSEPRVYIGSWSEWIRDPGRPISTVVG